MGLPPGSQQSASQGPQRLSVLTGHNTISEAADTLGTLIQSLRE